MTFESIEQNYEINLFGPYQINPLYYIWPLYLFLILFPYSPFKSSLGKPAKKNHWICEHAHTSLGTPPPTVSPLGYFFSRRFLAYWGRLVRSETDFVKFWVTFDQNNAKEGRPKFDILKVRGLMLMVKSVHIAFKGTF